MLSFEPFTVERMGDKRALSSAGAVILFTKSHAAALATAEAANKIRVRQVGACSGRVPPEARSFCKD